MNRLVIIGNGFDIAHGLKTRYMDFIDWYLNERVENLASTYSAVSKDCLLRLEIKDTTKFQNWYIYSLGNSYFKDAHGKKTYSGYETIQEIKKHPELFNYECCRFFNTIMQSIETKGWVDIENDYYQLLKGCVDNQQSDYSATELNEQLSFLQSKLVEYLRTLSPQKVNDNLHDAMITHFNPADFSTEGKERALVHMGLDINTFDETYPRREELNKLLPDRIMLLCFNYTNVARMYGNFKITHNYIHGELEHPEHIIFGYGDELDKNYQDIVDMNDNEMLKKIKSVKYVETSRYRELLEFLQAAPFQVLIMGHSCGNSDRTLLNTIFEHENCISIKPYYHFWYDGRDNYLDIVQNISRNFTNMKLFRDRVVNKEQCKTM